MRRLFVERFIASFALPPLEVVLDIDGWDDPTKVQQHYANHYKKKQDTLILQSNHRKVRTELNYIINKD